MAQHDYILDNQSRANFRQDLNNALQAIATQNSATTAPATTYPYQIWADTTTNKLKIRDSANTTWIIIGALDTTNLRLLPLTGGNITGKLGFNMSNPGSILSLGNVAANATQRIAFYEADSASTSFYGVGMANPSSGIYGVGIWTSKTPADTNMDVFISNGKMGIGTSALGSKLTLGGAAANATQRIAFYEADSASTSFYGVGMANPSSGIYGVGIWTSKTPADTNMDVFISNGKMGIGVTNPSYPIHHSSGAFLSPGGVWINASSQLLKENFSTMNVLDKVMSLPIYEYNYIEDKHHRYFTPVSEDFHVAFGLGAPHAISAGDLGGVALQAIKELVDRLRIAGIQI